jgi:hypothetical protein
MTSRLRLAILGGAVGLIGYCYAASPPIVQDQRYHHFADQRTLFGVPNFWNVVSNLPFFAVAMYGAARRRRAHFEWTGERTVYGVLLAGTAAVGLGSMYYHLDPSDARLFWDRLPMSVIFMALVAAIAGERLTARTGRWMLAPLLLIGVSSVVYWRATGDLRLYAVVQFGSMMVVPLLLLLFPSRYGRSAGWIWGTVALYGVAKIAELGAHPWKHVIAAAALLVYVISMERHASVVQVREEVLV